MAGMNVTTARAVMAYNIAKQCKVEQVQIEQQQRQQEDIQLQAAQRMAMECTVYPFVGGNIDVYI